MEPDFGEYWRRRARGRHFRVRTVVHGDRNQAIDFFQQAVARHGGDILDFKEFSNLSLSCIVEIRAPNLLALVDSLAVSGWHVEIAPDRATLSAAPEIALEGTLQVTFAGGDGELRIPVPAVPG